MRLMEGVKMCLSSQAADIFDTDIQKLIPLYKFLSSDTDYADRYVMVGILCIVRI